MHPTERPERIRQELGVTDRNPYGNEGFFSKVVGIKPESLDYSHLLTQEQRGGIADLTVDRFMNPYDPGTMNVRSGISAGDPTILGTARAQRQAPSRTDALLRGGMSLLGLPFLGGIMSLGQSDPIAIQGSSLYNPELDPQNPMYKAPSMLETMVGGIMGTRR